MDNGGLGIYVLWIMVGWGIYPVDNSGLGYVLWTMVGWGYVFCG